MRLFNYIEKALAHEENIVKQKSRVNWIKKDDGNTIYFHNCCKGRWNTNKIISLEDQFGNIQEDPIRVAEIATTYFENLLGSNHEVEDFPEDIALRTVTEDQSLSLEKPFFRDEVLITLKSIAKHKSRGPDDFPVEFFLET